MASVREKYSLDGDGEDGDVVVVSAKRVRCDGPGGALGHPMVYLDMGLADRVRCKYCDRLFVFEGELGLGDGNAKT